MSKSTMLFAFLLTSCPVAAHEITQRVGGYTGTDGETRSAGGIGGVVEKGPFGDSGFSSAVYSVDASAEKIKHTDISKNDYMLDNFPEGSRVQKTIGVNTTHTFKKLTDARLGGSWSSDSVTSSKSWSAGAGQWWFHDTIQTNVDFSQTMTEQPRDSILDNDFQLIELGPKSESRGATFGLKHLASPTTIWGASYTRVSSLDRPRLDAYALNVKQFISPWSAAVHGSVARLINTGTVSTNTTTGSLAGVQAELALLKTLWQGASSRASYRYVREDEQTRAFGDHLVYGADSYSLGFAQEFKKGVVSDKPLTAHVAATRYVSNADMKATLGEAGLAMKF